MKKLFLTIATTIALTILASCTSDSELGTHASSASVTITATAQQLQTRAPGDIKTTFYPGDEITLTHATVDYTYQFTTAQTWQPTGNALLLPIDDATPITITAKYTVAPDPLTATATTTDGTLTLSIAPDGSPLWNINLSFTHQKAVIDVTLLAPDLTNITALMQTITIGTTTSTTPTDILVPEGNITTVTVVAAGITYPATTNTTLTANTRYHLTFVCSPTTPTVTIAATTPTWTEGGTGTVPAGYHYYIDSEEEFQKWATDMQTPANLTKKAIQLIDINWNAAWTPVGTDANPFTGVYNGNGHTITGLKPGVVNIYSGMFGRVGLGAVLTGIHLRGVKIDNAATTAGLLAGYAYDDTHSNPIIISLCSAQGTIKIPFGEAGGLVGTAYNTHITRCYADATITATAPNTHTYCGGLVGYNYITSIIACGANTRIEITDADGNYGYYAGGLVGYNYNNSNIFFCYATGTVNIEGTGSNRCAGGLVGSNYSSTIAHCYATAVATKLFVGFNNTDATIVFCHPTDEPDTRYDLVADPDGIKSNIHTIHRDPDNGYHDALNPITVNFYGAKVWTNAEFPLINYNHNGGK